MVLRLQTVTLVEDDVLALILYSVTAACILQNAVFELSVSFKGRLCS